METPQTPLTLLFLGKAGAGKGTQAHFLAQKLSVRCIGTGEMLRAFSKAGLPASTRVEDEYLKQGKLAPTWLVTYLWTHEILRADPASCLLFDGSPRMLEEAIHMDDVLGWAGRVPPKVFLIDISDEEAMRRLLSRKTCTNCKHIYLGNAPEAVTDICSACGGKLEKRTDDEPEAIARRLAYFQTDVMPTIRHYQEKGWLIGINGDQTPEGVFTDIAQHLGIAA